MSARTLTDVERKAQLRATVAWAQARRQELSVEDVELLKLEATAAIRLKDWFGEDAYADIWRGGGGDAA